MLDPLAGRSGILVIDGAAVGSIGQFKTYRKGRATRAWLFPASVCGSWKGCSQRD